MKIVIDIETIPDQREGARQSFIDQAINEFKAPSSLTKTQAAEALGLSKEEAKPYSADQLKMLWVEMRATEEGEKKGIEAWRKTALDGTKGQVFSFAITEVNSGIMFSDYSLNERKLLESFNRFLAMICSKDSAGSVLTPLFVGHNVANFDLKFLFRRFVINGIRPACLLNFAGRHGVHYFDNSIAWCGHKEYISQDNLCKALGIEGKPDDIDGSKVWDYVEAGKYEQVLKYNEDDVMKAEAIYNRLTFSDSALVESC